MTFNKVQIQIIMEGFFYDAGKCERECDKAETNQFRVRVGNETQNEKSGETGKC